MAGKHEVRVSSGAFLPTYEAKPVCAKQAAHLLTLREALATVRISMHGSSPVSAADQLEITDQLQ
jgi:hypothetical protein